MLCIELNEIGIQGLDLTKKSKETPIQWSDGSLNSPGIGAIDDNTWCFGNAAQANVRIAPAETFTGFWANLNLPEEPVSKSFPEVTNIMAAYGHLESLTASLNFDDQPIVWVCPSTFTDTALDAVKDISNDLGLKGTEVLDAAIAALLGNQDRISGSVEELFFLDITLQEVYLTRLSRNEKWFQVQSVAREETLGFSALETKILHTADTYFFQQTRIRPSRKGETEQALYEQIHEWLFSDGDTTQHTIDVAGRTVTITHQEIAEVLNSYGDTLVHFILEKLKTLNKNGGNRPLIVSERISMLPGLLDQLSRLPEMTLLPISKKHGICHGGSIWRALLEEGSVTDPSPKRIEVLDAEQPKSNDARSPEIETAPLSSPVVACYHTGEGGFLDYSPPSVTHLLFQGRCIPMEHDTFRIGREIPDTEPGLRIEHTIPEVHSLHCELRRRPDGFLELTGWGDGKVWHNDEPAEVNQPLVVGDYLGIGGHRLELMLLSLVQSD